MCPIRQTPRQLIGGSCVRMRVSVKWLVGLKGEGRGNVRQSELNIHPRKPTVAEWLPWERADFTKRQRNRKKRKERILSEFQENWSRAAAIRFLLPGRRNVSSFLDIRPDFWHQRNLSALYEDRLFISSGSRTDRQTGRRGEGEKPPWHCFLFYMFCSIYTNYPGWMEKLLHMVEALPLQKHKKVTKKGHKYHNKHQKTCHYSIYLIWKLFAIV